MKVLVVDDDVVSRMMLMHLIDSNGRYDIVEAEDGADAWRQLTAGLRPAACFCDLRMPHMSGIELLQKVRGDGELATLPFVLVSSANDRATVEAAIEAGATGYIVKPFDPPQVRRQLEALAAPVSTLHALAAPVSTPHALAAPVSTPHVLAAPVPAPGNQAEEPAATLARLGIDAARLRAYLAGLETQLLAAEAEPLAGAMPEEAAARLQRLREGCATLGLTGAAAMLAATPPGAAGLAGVLAAVRAAVRRQVGRLDA